MTLGFYLIFVGLAVTLLDWLRGRNYKESVDGEMKFGNISIKGSAGISVLILGILVYLLEEGFLSFKPTN